jgi:predicted RNA-binding Zn ribbon-like protein
MPGEPGAPVAFEAALSVSALSLLPPARSERIRVCANCRWLFLDESRNRSRIWCDMTVCGNRQKAQRHYRRRKIEEDAHA